MTSWSDEGVLQDLANLEPLDYEKVRRATGKKLGFRLPLLDDEVAKRRPRKPMGAEPKPSPDEEPWPEPVDGNQLLQELLEMLERYVVAESEALVAVAAWILHAHAHEAFDISPILLVTSPVKGCGKSTLLDVVEALVPRPMMSANTTAPALFRSTANRPTILVDEADLYFNEDRTLVNFFNAGHRPGVPFRRCEGEDHHVVEFNAWTPKALAQIGMPRWPTLVDRSILVPLRRKLPGERVRRFRRSRPDPELPPLRRRAIGWAADNHEALAALEPSIPAGLENRVADNWEPLFALADQAGGDWRKRIEHAAKVLRPEDEDRRVELLRDLREILEPLRTRGARFVSTANIVSMLTAMPERPYQTINRGKEVNGHWLGRQLRFFDIKSSREGAKGPRGYHIEPLQDAWTRYLDPEASAPDPPIHPAQAAQAAQDPGDPVAPRPLEPDKPDGSGA